MANRVPELTNVVVLMGGWSVEREVSLASGTACTKALEEAGVRVAQLDPKRDVAEVLAALWPDVVFNALHGRWGEDGTLQGILETLEIPYTHSGVLASALAMDKPRAKEIFRGAGVPTVEHRVVDLETAATRHVMNPPYVVKPANEGSSVGVHIVHGGANTPPTALLEQSAIYGGAVMVERFIPGRELTCAVMGNVALGVIEIQPAVGFYDYRAKYAPGGSTHVLPAPVPCDIYRKVQQYSLDAHMALGCRGVSRADFRYDDGPGKEAELYILEVNTQPGMTGTSLVPELAQHAGHSMQELVKWLIDDASLDR